MNRKIFTILGLLLILAGGVWAEDKTVKAPADVEGAWKFEFADEKGQLLGTNYSMIKRSGNKLTAKDLASGETGPVTVTGRAVTVGVVPRRWTSKNGDPLTLNFSTVDSTLKFFDVFSGTVTGASEPMRITVRAIKLPAVWACGHLNPTHTASSKEEMQQLSKEHSCDGWHQVASQ